MIYRDATIRVRIKTARSVQELGWVVDELARSIGVPNNGRVGPLDKIIQACAAHPAVDSEALDLCDLAAQALARLSPPLP